MTPAEIDAFLSKTRQAILLRTRPDGTATGAPVWFDWDGTTVQIFSMATAPKVERIEQDPRISVLVTNDLDEAPAWVRFDGTAELDFDTDARPLAVDVLAPRYWDVTDPEVVATLDEWRAAPPEAFAIIRLRPDRIASGA